MIPIDSKSYPYLAVAQHYKLDCGTLLLNDISVIEEQQKHLKLAISHKMTDIKELIKNLKIK